MKIYVFLLSIVLVWSCSSNGKSDTPNFTSNKSNSEINTASSVIQQVQKDSIRDHNNFYLVENYYLFDETINKFQNDSQTEIFISPEFSWGDCSGKYKRLYKTNYEYYIFKSDCGEYGFSNNQFYFVRDSLQMVRNFSMYIAKWQSDTTPIRWDIKEEIYLFDNDSVHIVQRDKLTADCYDHTLSGKEYKHNYSKGSAFLTLKMKEFSELMDLVVSSED